MVGIKAVAFANEKATHLPKGICLATYSNSSSGSREDTKLAIAFAVMQCLDESRKLQCHASQVKVEITFTNDL